MNQEDRIFISDHFSIRFRRSLGGQTRSIQNRDYAIVYMLEGLAEFRFDDSSATVDAGCLALFDPNTVGFVSGRDNSDIVISISASYLIDSAVRIKLLSSGKLVSFRMGPHCRDARLDRIMRDLVDEVRTEDPGREELIAALIDQLAIYILRRHSVLKTSDRLELSRVGIVDRRIRRAIELMEAHLDRDLPLSEMAAAAYLSPFHFSRLFKKLMGNSPHAYLAILRNQRAQTLLADTGLSITDVAVRVGYSGSSHFTKAFKDATGLSPRAFRKAIIPRSGARNS
jgi:AraC-like DNA-binding protein